MHQAWSDVVARGMDQHCENINRAYLSGTELDFF